MDSDELRQMSISNAYLALNQANGFKISNRYNLTLEQREGIKKMMVLFTSDKWRHWMFKVCIGKFSNGKDQWIGMKGMDIFRHLETVYNGGTYGEDGQEILNGMRECYLKHKE